MKCHNRRKTLFGRRRTAMAMIALWGHFFCGCDKQNKIIVNDPAALSIAVADLQCNMRCPVYNFALRGTGELTYEGIEDVPTIGIRNATLSPDKIDAILKAMNEARFLEMDDKKFDDPSDMSGVTITLSFDGKTKKLSSAKVPFPPDYVPRGFLFERGMDQQYRFLKLTGEICLIAGIDRWAKCSPKCTSFLLQMPSLNRRGPDGDTILLELVKSKAKTIQVGFANSNFGLDTMIEAGADVNVSDNQGLTPLMITAMNGDIDSVRLLLAHGADPTAKNKRGQTAYDLCKVPEIRKLLSTQPPADREFSVLRP
jgi:hypothetical protein